MCLASNLMTRKLKPYGSSQMWARTKSSSQKKKNLKWPENKAKVLGVWISTDPTVTLNLNYTKKNKLEKVRNLLSGWEYWQLTLIGKDSGYKEPCIISTDEFILTPLATNRRFISQINNIFYSFLWNNKGDKIKRTILINSYDHGGLKMVDLASFNNLRLRGYIHVHCKYLDTSHHGRWKEFVKLDLEQYGGNLIFKRNLNKTNSLKIISVKNNFTRELLEIHCMVWSQFWRSYKNQATISWATFMAQLTRIKNKPVFNNELFSLGISKVKDFVKKQYDFLSHKDFIEKYKFHLQPLKYFGLISALKQVNNSSISQNPTLSIS